MVEVALLKHFDRPKLFRLLNFVDYLMTLPQDLQSEFKTFANKPKILEKMEPTKEFLLTFGGRAITEIIEQGIEQGIEQERERGREEKVMLCRQGMGLSIEQIANITNFTVEYVQSVINRYEKS